VTQESHVPGAEAIIGPDGVLSSVGTIIIGDGLGGANKSLLQSTLKNDDSSSNEIDEESGTVVDGG
jgi:hypothetical protein